MECLKRNSRALLTKTPIADKVMGVFLLGVKMDILAKILASLFIIANLVMIFRWWLGFIRDEYYVCGCYNKQCEPALSCTKPVSRLMMESFKYHHGYNNDFILIRWASCAIMPESMEEWVSVIKSRNLVVCLLNSLLLLSLCVIVYGVSIILEHYGITTYVIVVLLVFISVLGVSLYLRTKNYKLNSVEKRLS